MKRKFLPANTSNETVINKKRTINIVTFDQLKQINGLVKNSNSEKYFNQFNTKIRQGKNTLCFTHHKKNDSGFNYNSPLNQSYRNSNSNNVRESFPSLNTDKLNFRCAFSQMCKKNTNGIINNNKITLAQKELINKRNTFNCSAFSQYINTKQNSSDNNQSEEQKGTPKFCQPEHFNQNNNNENRHYH